MATGLKSRCELSVPHEFVAVDVETTGFSPIKDDIIELSAVRYRDGQEIEAFESLAKPRMPVNSFISSLTGITNEMLADAPTSAEVVRDFIRFAGESVLVGHNVVFDLNFIRSTAERNEFPEVTNEFIDTLPVMRRMYPKLKSYKLDALVEACGLSGDGFHRAGYDCRMTAAILLHAANGSAVAQIDAEKPKRRRFREYVKTSELHPEGVTIDEGNPCCGKVFVFTGELSHFTRRQAMQEVVNRGGCCKSSVTRNTNFLVEGGFEGIDVGDDGESTKQQRVRELQLKGCDIQIISESAFLDMLEHEEAAEQETLFDVTDAAEEQAIFDRLRPILAQQMEAHWMNPDRLIFALKGLKGASAVYLFTESNLVFRLCCRKKSRWVELPKNNAFSEKDLPEGMPYKITAGNYIRIPLDDEWNDAYTSVLLAALEGEFESYPCDFSCCSAYLQCSNARRCIHPDDMLYMGCSYRKKLYKNLVFFGEQ